MRLDAIPGQLEARVTISRVRHGNETHAATVATVIHHDDRLAVVGLRSDEDLVLAESAVTFRRVVVTDRDALGKTVGELNLDDRFGVAVTCVTRADLQMSAVPGLRLHLGRVGRIGRQVWHMPVNTNFAFREFGIALFFATFFTATGLQWLPAGVCLTVLPLLLIGIFTRVGCKMNFMDLSDLLAGSMTDPPPLAFASNVAGSDAPTVAYEPVEILVSSYSLSCSCTCSPRTASENGARAGEGAGGKNGPAQFFNRRLVHRQACNDGRNVRHW